MKEIHCEEIKDPKSINELLTVFHEKQRPSTYFSNGKMQCAAYKNRSIEDLLLLIAHYFPEETENNCLLAIFAYVEPIKAKIILHCPDIHKPVVFNYHREGCLSEINSMDSLDRVIDEDSLMDEIESVENDDKYYKNVAKHSLSDLEEIRITSINNKT